MDMIDRFPWKGAALALTIAVFAGCGGSAPEPETDVTQVEDEPVEVPQQVEPPVREETVTYVDPNVEYRSVLKPIRFEFDKYRITAEAKPTLEAIGGLLSEHGDWKVLVEGHCDERGTAEYNLALGEQRALATKRYLVSLGVSESRFQTISYGEERPVDPRSTEEAWTKNRRAEFRVEAPGS